MNFLAHLHIADHCQSSLLGNLLGDFVKGDPDKQYPQAIANGIRLHRFVDSYTDSHTIVKSSKQWFEKEQRRFAPIALDMFWDHCLAKHWGEFHPAPLRDFVEYSELIVTRSHKPLPERFTQVTQHMWRGRWLESYADFDNIAYALQRMSQRSLRMGVLANCADGLSDHYDQLEEQFFPLYRDVLQQSKLTLL
ncbi:DUF479 domain-containing protein [Vibrio astriarenae]|uniref:DUF479 domain-containing protein n=1 Tax=Vibrio astriarenae TaxID=1481923 RepID=A0A7Z2T8I3_9VIBR|nr:ACP phosphodiesterase [Vibrio astriarenae]QIA66172.1 DUF479 domain-containing protein [Vibrio astriarenae]